MFTVQRETKPLIDQFLSQPPPPARGCSLINYIFSFLDPNVQTAIVKLAAHSVLTQEGGVPLGILFHPHNALCSVHQKLI